MKINASILDVTLMPLCLFMISCANNDKCNNLNLGYGVTTDRDPRELGGQLGIMYGDSLISAHYYSRIDFPDSIASIVFPYKTEDSNHFDSHGYAILDLQDRKFIYEEDAFFPIDTIIPIDRFNYALYNDYGRHFTTLRLTEISPDKYNFEFIPHFCDAAIPVSEFIRIGEMHSEKPKDGHMQAMLNHNPSACRLLEYVFNMWGEECSPTNDLNFARAMRYFIAKDYNGDETAALAEVHSILKMLGSGSTQDMTLSMSIERCLENMQLSWEYERIIIDFPLYEAEYIAWHNMTVAIANYMNFLYDNTDWYQCKRMDNEETIRDMCIDRKEQLKIERQILIGKMNYSVNNDTIKTLADIDSITQQYHHPEFNGYYHPMWHEIRPTIKEWLQSRDDIASSLSPDKAKTFRNLDRELIDRLYYSIKSLDYWEMRPCFPD